MQDPSSRRMFLHKAGSLAILALAPGAVGAAPDAADAWDALLKRHVRWNEAGVASTVDYKAISSARSTLDTVLKAFSAVSRSAYDAMSRADRLAFLINAYNAFTIDLILTKYPDLKSIKDLGGLFSSPWKKKFFRLLGEERSLDDIEHGMIRAPGVFDEPRIHFVVNCASIGCPALRPEAMRGATIDSQLEDSARRFLRDRSRNRLDPVAGELRVSKIFDWYGGDFSKGYRGIDSLNQFFAMHADALGDDAGQVSRIRAGKLEIDFLDYDWRLNDRR
ncbi:MAG: DUF547 domain-containing protein [Burkholderiaceae bacterium]|nr:DUF547 domain-containing protein [Burkholderiaceae bacterium]